MKYLLINKDACLKALTQKGLGDLVPLVSDCIDKSERACNNRKSAYNLNYFKDLECCGRKYSVELTTDLAPNSYRQIIQGNDTRFVGVHSLEIRRIDYKNNVSLLVFNSQLNITMLENLW